MSSTQVTSLVYQADLRATEAITPPEAAELRVRRQVAMDSFKPSLRDFLKKYSPLAVSCTLVAALWLMPNQEFEGGPDVIAFDELSSLIDPSSWVVEGKAELSYDEEWVLYNDWSFYEWLAEEQLADAY